MCGIVGMAYPRFSRDEVKLEAVRRMRDKLSHRGPDDKGEFIELDGKVGLGHRRLSIVDIEGGHQPMFNEDSSIILVYNGEIYNHTDLRQELERKSHSYRTRCDTETIIHLYEEYGTECLKHLRGMFAFAIWDRNLKRVFLARDRLGVKPLYYFHGENGSLFFASEIKSLLEVIKPQLNYSSLAERMANHGACSDETLFNGIKLLLPGHFLLWQDGKILVQKYWDLSFEPKTIGDDSFFVENWLELFRQSVRIRLMSDVPLGMFLSGGIDSSAICAMMTEEAGEQIKTFSVGFDDDESNELQFARIVAKHFQTDHHEIIVTGEDFFSSLPKLIWQNDEPISFEACIPLYFVACLASKHVKVVLTGEGSDETLAGYARYVKAIKLIEYGKRYESLLPLKFRQFIRLLLENSDGKLSRTFLVRKANIEELFFDNFAVFNRKSQDKLFTKKAKEKLQDAYFHQKRLLEASEVGNILDKLLYVDMKTYLQELLMKQDKMSMAASIESREPFLDHNLVEFCAKMPAELKIRSGTTKWLLRQAMKKKIPEEILSRPKMGFPVPVNKWLRTRFKKLIDEYVLSERVISRGVFNKEYLEYLTRRFLSGADDSSKIFRLISFEIWYRQFIENDYVAGKIH
ncbi:MAG: asparagine synthase (glutamine-hydrolyzing) [Pyrinomonadaceae bacterium]|nr:asparagine synthase (glutamine-hydrolyzing) [Pyrinomonadaceae bacterium]MCX7639267.1 asparagine synthase (glutamine-hydrolyzing) [Pyrinomonadaceae bacterium]MDW8303511.1 asparagine synthase (glutamine-hydrolyzing) [Acidobacteriota bacterium]